MSNDERRFTDEEFALVLRKAMALHDRGGADTGRLPGSGMTMEDMKAVAREVGIDPALIEQAVALSPARHVSQRQQLLGGPTRYRMEHSARSLVTREELADVLDLVRREMQHPGRVTSELDGVVWETEGELSQFHLGLSPRGEKTEVRLTVHRDGAFILTWFLPVTGGLVVAGITGAALDPDSAAAGLAIISGGLGGGLALARALWGRSSRIISERASRLMEAVVAKVEHGGGNEA
jgi:hypothetical protein